MKYAIINTDGTHELRETNSPMDIRILRAAVAAPAVEGVDTSTIEAISGRNLTIYLNENGKSLPLEVNKVMTNFAHAHGLISPFDWIVGNCVVLGGVDDEGDDTDINDRVLIDILSHVQPN